MVTMSIRKASFIKARAILGHLEKNRDRIGVATEAPEEYARTLGVELTPAEIGIISDVLNDTANSQYSQPPEGYADQMGELKRLWKG